MSEPKKKTFTVFRVWENIEAESKEDAIRQAQLLPSYGNQTWDAQEDSVGALRSKWQWER